MQLPPLLLEVEITFWEGSLCDCLRWVCHKQASPSITLQATESALYKLTVTVAMTE